MLQSLKSQGVTTNLNLAARFWTKVAKGQPDQCWPWTGSTNDLGYGVMRPEGRRSGPTVKASRVSMLLDGRDPGNLCVLHRCDNPPCVNPAHLFLGTVAENNHDMAAKGRAAMGERNGVSKLASPQIVEIRSLLGIGVKQRLIAAQFGVSQSTISSIKLERRWRHAH